MSGTHEIDLPDGRGGRAVAGALDHRAVVRRDALCPQPQCEQVQRLPLVTVSCG
ncbi:hypothetical protein [Amycolatopsis sp. YIM 10]|uniref:hypothetical protein n=1 Tax=Amycolatopsis sp. YIM 10 TaxID=2653857 RepID=UPI0012900F95|nr:hypothetical protein [Amycolatopsis sp. YIM 10]